MQYVCTLSLSRTVAQTYGKQTVKSFITNYLSAIWQPGDDLRCHPVWRANQGLSLRHIF